MQETKWSCVGSKEREEIGDKEKKFKITEYCEFYVKIAYVEACL